MSHEFYQIMVGAPTVSIHSWKQLALWSLEYSCLSDKEKREGKEKYLKTWEAFCQQIVADYSHLLDGERINQERATAFYTPDRTKSISEPVPA